MNKEILFNDIVMLFKDIFTKSYMFGLYQNYNKIEDIISKLEANTEDEKEYLKNNGYKKEYKQLIKNVIRLKTKWL